MTDAEKISTLKTLLDDGSGVLPSDAKLLTYLALSKAEILQWKYHLVGGVPTDITDVPAKDENAQIFAVVAGYSHAGAEGESTHIENGVHHTFLYEDMIGYIRNHVMPIVRVGAVG